MHTSLSNRSASQVSFDRHPKSLHVGAYDVYFMKRPYERESTYHALFNLQNLINRISSMMGVLCAHHLRSTRSNKAIR